MKRTTPKNIIFLKTGFLKQNIISFLYVLMKRDLDFSETSSNPVLVTRGQYRTGLTPITNIPQTNTHKCSHGKQTLQYLISIALII